MAPLQKSIHTSFIALLITCGATVATADTQAQIKLGQHLFYEADLSINGTMSCATCHEQKRAFTDGNEMHPGALDDPAKRNVPGLANIASFKNLTWAHNSLSGLAQHALIPIKGTDPVEMGMHGYEDEINKRLSQNKCYQKLFSSAFPQEKGAIDLGTVTRALESFLKTMVSKNSLYDQAKKAQQALPTREAQEGEKLFFTRAKCSTCHSAPLFSDDDFHQVQEDTVSRNDRVRDYGLYDVTRDLKDKNIFRTPSLRNVAFTAPYWHNGSAKTITQAIQKHNLSINKNLKPEELDKLVSFLETLSDHSFITDPAYAKPGKKCP